MATNRPQGDLFGWRINTVCMETLVIFFWRNNNTYASCGIRTYDLSVIQWWLLHLGRVGKVLVQYQSVHVSSISNATFWKTHPVFSIGKCCPLSVSRPSEKGTHSRCDIKSCDLQNEKEYDYSQSRIRRTAVHQGKQWVI